MLGLLVLFFARAYCSVLGSFVDYRVRRHGLVVESKRQRIAYLQDMAMRQGLTVEDDGPDATPSAMPHDLQLAGTEADPASTSADDAPLQQAA